MGAQAQRAGRVKLIVCDTGPLVHLFEANLLNLLEAAGKVLMPPSVAKELEGAAPRPAASEPTGLPLVDGIARVLARLGEFEMRAALGARPGGVVRQVTIENGLGLGAAFVLVAALVPLAARNQDARAPCHRPLAGPKRGKGRASSV